MLSFIIPAHDEEASLGAVLEAIDTAASPLGEAYETIVVDDASSDQTSQIAAVAGARVVSIALRHIAAARNAGAAAARGDRYIFVDADTLVSAEVVSAAVEALENGAVGGGATVRFDEPIPVFAKLLVPPFLWLGRVLRWSSGCFLFSRREAFEAVSGFDTSLFAAEDIAFSQALKRQGRFVILREVVHTSGRKLRTHSTREILRTLLGVTLAGRRALRSRKHLHLWYGGRRQDPETKR